MFKVERWGSCSTNVVTPDITKNGEAEWVGQPSWWWVPRPTFKWLKRWGFWPVAYLLDFIEPIFKTDFITECNNIIKASKTISNKDTEDYQDMFDIKLIATKNNKLESDKDFKKLNPSFSKAAWEAGINVV